MTSEAMTVLVSLLTSGSVVAFVEFLINRHDTRHDQLDAMQKSIAEVSKKLDELEIIKQDIRDTKRSVVNIGQDRITWTCKRHLRDGYITVREYAELKDLYESYEKIGGNSDAKAYYEEVTKLPRKAD